jgi:RNA polymerase sigma-70 factor (ECF subfamily)
VEGWLYRTGLRLALDHIRKERRRSYYEALASWFMPAAVSGQDDEQACVKQVLASIKPQQAALLVLRNDGLTYAEIASALDLNPTSVGTLLSRAEEAFRKEYIKRYGSRG